MRKLPNTLSRFSQHAELRCRQRGVRSADVALLEAHADIIVPAGDGAEQLFLSEERARAMIGEGVAVAIVDRLRRLTVVCAGPVVLTVHHAELGRRKRLQPRKRGQRNAYCARR